MVAVYVFVMTLYTGTVFGTEVVFTDKLASNYTSTVSQICYGHIELYRLASFPGHHPFLKGNNQGTGNPLVQFACLH